MQAKGVPNLSTGVELRVMKSLRPATIALWAIFALGSSGCRTAGVKDLTRLDPFPSRTSESATELLAEHNRNAERVQSLEARPSITIDRQGGVSGSLAFERPKNFKLVLSSTMTIGNLADIGSNDQEFWFWVKNSRDKAVFFCNYDDAGESPLSSSLQPDWIIEAFGLNVISPEEAAQIKVTPGSEPNTLVLTHKAHERQGQTFVKETIIHEDSRRIREHRIYSAGKKALLAKAVVSDYAEYTSPGEAGQDGEKVFLPKNMRLEWFQQPLSLVVVLNGVKVNPRFTQKRRENLFVEPEIKGFDRKNLAELAGMEMTPSSSAANPDDRTTVRQSLPIPPPRVRLSAPSPLGLRHRANPDAERSALVALELPLREIRGVEEVVGPQIPTVSEPAPSFVQANTGWKTRFAPAVER